MNKLTKEQAYKSAHAMARGGYGGSKMVQALHQLKIDNQINIDSDNTVEII